MAFDIAHDAIGAEHEPGRPWMKLDITPRARRAAESEVVGELNYFRKVGNPAQVAAHQRCWSEQLDREPIGLNLLGDVT